LSKCLNMEQTGRRGHGRLAAAMLTLTLTLGHRLIPADGFLAAARAPGAPRGPAGLVMGAAEEKMFPVLHRLAGGTWQGEMRYAGPSLEPAPFTLRGTTRCVLEGKCVQLESSVTLPNGKTRTVVMQGKREGETGGSFRLDPLDAAGPIYMRIAELEPDTVLVQEFNRTDGRVVLTSSISVVEGGEELVQIAHETADDPAQGTPIEGIQVWRMRRSAEVKA
jgi:hypothetical protein